MMKLAWTAALVAACAAGACKAPQESPAAKPSAAQDDARMQWWREARFGMFIHWGLYSVPAGEWGGRKDHGEWIYTSAQIPIGRYEKFRDEFNPVKFDADRWVRAAKAAGMKYITITTKHHDGFCLFDSKETDYDVMSTPFKRDIMKELAEACRRHGMKMCWYHSIMDWHHPDYLPRRDWETRGAGGADMNRYVEHLRAQVKELLTNYGDIGVMWFDGQWESTWNHERGSALYDLCRSLQPGVIVNNRVDVGRGDAGATNHGGFAGDFGTPEQEIPATGLGGADWETCMTMNDHWGFCRADENWKSTRTLLRNLSDIASKGGNFLLNVGPTAEGEFPRASVERLEQIGKWLSVNGDAIYGTQASPFEALPWGRCTVKRDGGRSRLYLHVFDWPVHGKLVLGGLGNKIINASLLSEPASKLAVTSEQGRVTIQVPRIAPDADISVVMLEIVGAPIVYQAPKIEADSKEFVQALNVTFRSGPGLELRFTTDGSEPTAASPVAPPMLQIHRTTGLRVKAFHDGAPVSDTVDAAFTKVVPRRALSILKYTPGLPCEIYQGKFSSADAVTTGKLLEASPAGRGISVGGEEYVGRRYDGFINIPADEMYLFALTSDDGSKLWIDEQLVVDNDGFHGAVEKRGAAALGAGPHRFRLQWFNASGGAALSLQWAPLGSPLAPVPDSVFSH